MEVAVKPCAGKLADNDKREGTDQLVSPAAEIVTLWPDIRVGEQGAQACELLLAVRPPPAQPRNPRERPVRCGAAVAGLRGHDLRRGDTASTGSTSPGVTSMVISSLYLPGKSNPD